VLTSNQQSNRFPVVKNKFNNESKSVNISRLPAKVKLKRIFLPLFDIQKSFHGPSSMSNFGYNITLREQMNESMRFVLLVKITLEQ
jgi:hypothetical protein